MTDELRSEDRTHYGPLKFKITPWRHQYEAIVESTKWNQFAFFFEMGCLAHDTLIKINRNGAHKKYSIEKLFRLFNKKELCENEEGFSKGDTFCRSLVDDVVRLNKIAGIVRSGEKELYRLVISEKHNSIKATLDHKFFTKRGFVPLGELTSNDLVAVDLFVKHQKVKNKKVGKKPRYNLRYVGPFYPYGHVMKARKFRKAHRRAEVHRLMYEASLNRLSLEEFIAKTYEKNDLKFVDPNLFHIHHKDHNTKNNCLSNLVRLPKGEHLALHGDYKYFSHGKVCWRKVKRIEYVGKGMTYDICCEAPHHNFVANNFVVHNSGKTMASVQALRWKFLVNQRLLRTLILAPPITLMNWKREIHQNSNLKDNEVIILYGKGKDREKLFEQSAWNAEGQLGKVFITNYESLYMKDLFNMFKTWSPEALLFDEAHKLKSIQARRTKKAIELADLSRYRFLLTGTPVLNSPMDLFSQFRILDKGDTFGKNFFAFRATYFEDKNAAMPRDRYFPNWVIKRNANDVIAQRISKYSVRIKKEDCLDLPPLVKKIVYVELGKEQARHYQTMKKFLVTTIMDRACTAELAITKSLRLQQIASGYIKTEDGTEFHLEDNPRRDALESLLEEICPSNKVLVWACFKENYEQIRGVCEKLNLKYVEVHGDVGEKDRFRNVDNFNSDPRIRVFIGHPGSGGIGINLVSASYSIFYSRSFSLEHELQAEARNHRGGSEIHAKITRIDLVSKDTIDEHIQKSLANKEAISERLLRDIARKL